MSALKKSIPAVLVGETRTFRRDLGLPPGWLEDTRLEARAIAGAPPVVVLPHPRTAGAGFAAPSGIALATVGDWCLYFPYAISAASSIHRFNARTGAALEVPTPYGFTVSMGPGPSACARGNRAVFCGGVAASTVSNRHVEVNPENGVLTQLANLPEALVAHAIVGVGPTGGEQLLVIGGSNTSTNGAPAATIATCRLYTRETNSWASFDNAPAAIRYAVAGRLPSGKVFVIGDGFGEQYALADPAAAPGSQWTERRNLPATKAGIAARLLFQTEQGVAYLTAAGTYYEYNEAADEFVLLPHKLPQAFLGGAGDTATSFTASAAVAGVETEGGQVMYVQAAANDRSPLIGVLGGELTPLYVNAVYIGE